MTGTTFIIEICQPMYKPIKNKSTMRNLLLLVLFLGTIFSIKADYYFYTIGTTSHWTKFTQDPNNTDYYYINVTDQSMLSAKFLITDRSDWNGNNKWGNLTITNANEYQSMTQNGSDANYNITGAVNKVILYAKGSDLRIMFENATPFTLFNWTDGAFANVSAKDFSPVANSIEWELNFESVQTISGQKEFLIKRGTTNNDFIKATDPTNQDITDSWKYARKGDGNNFIVDGGKYASIRIKKVYDNQYKVIANTAKSTAPIVFNLHDVSAFGTSLNKFGFVQDNDDSNHYILYFDQPITTADQSDRKFYITIEDNGTIFLNSNSDTNNATDNWVDISNNTGYEYNVHVDQSKTYYSVEIKVLGNSMYQVKVNTTSTTTARPNSLTATSDNKYKPYGNASKATNILLGQKLAWKNGLISGHPIKSSIITFYDNAKKVVSTYTLSNSDVTSVDLYALSDAIKYATITNDFTNHGLVTCGFIEISPKLDFIAESNKPTLEVSDLAHQTVMDGSNVKGNYGGNVKWTFPNGFVYPVDKFDVGMYDVTANNTAPYEGDIDEVTTSSINYRLDSNDPNKVEGHDYANKEHFIYIANASKLETNVTMGFDVEPTFNIYVSTNPVSAPTDDMYTATTGITPYTYKVSTQALYTQDTPTGIEDSKKENVSITAGISMIEVKGAKTIKIYNVTGQMIKSTSETIITLPSGLYIVKTDSKTAKLVVK